MNLQGIAEAYSQVHEKKDSSYLETDMKKRQKNNEKARKDMEKMGTSMKNPHFEEMSPDEKSMKKFQELQKNVDQKKKNIRGNDSAEQKARLEKKRGMKLDDHPQFKKEEAEVEEGYGAPGHNPGSGEKSVARAKAMMDKKGQKGAPGLDAMAAAKKEHESKRGVKKEEVSGIAAAYQAVYDKEEVIDEADSLAAMAARREKRLKAQRKREGTTATGQDFGHDYGLPDAERKKRQKAEFDAFIGRGKKKTNEEVEAVDEGLTGARADRARQMQDTEIKKGGGKRTDADRDTAFRLGTGTAEKGSKKVGGRGGDEYGDRGKGNAAKRRMKEDLEATGKFTAEEIEAILAQDIEEGKGAAALGGLVGNIAGRLGGMALGGGGLKGVPARIGSIAGGGAGAALGAKKGRKGSAAVGGAVGAAGGGLGSALGGAIASSYEPEGNPIHEVFKDEIKEFTRRSIRNVV